MISCSWKINKSLFNCPGRAVGECVPGCLDLHVGFALFSAVPTSITLSCFLYKQEGNQQ